MLTEPSLKGALNKWLTGGEIQGVLARRDLIVKAFDNKGESALFDLTPGK